MTDCFDTNAITVKAVYLLERELLEKICKQGGCIIKGAPLSFNISNSPYTRISNDIDILAEKEKICDIERLLIQHGYIPISKSAVAQRLGRIMSLQKSHQLLPYYKVIDGISVMLDLNFDITWGEYEGKKIRIHDFLNDWVNMEIYGTKIKTLPPLKAMIQLILHHYKDMNSLFLLATRKSIRYDMFKDVYYLLKNNLDAIPLDKLYAMSAEYEIIPYVFYVLYYTGQVFDDDLLKQYIEAFRTPEGEALLNCYGLCKKERREWKCDFKTRLDSDNLYELIKEDLTERDKEKIAINKRVFLGISE